MKRGLKAKDSVVKIDSVLFSRIEEFISKEENRLKFVNKKQFVDLAVSDFFNKINLKSSKK